MSPWKIGAIVIIASTSLYAQIGEPTLLLHPIPPLLANHMTVGTDGAIWFTQGNTAAIGRMNTAGVIKNVPLPSGYLAGDIAAGSDEAVWFTLSAQHSIGRISATGEFTEYPLNPQFSPDRITTGFNGALWFSLNDGSLPGWTITDMTAGPDGAIWFTDYFNEKIGKFTSSGLQTFPAPASSNITPGPDGALWFTTPLFPSPGSVGRITTGGIVTKYSQVVSGDPQAISVGPDGNMWVSCRDLPSSIYNTTRFTTSGVVIDTLPFYGSEILNGPAHSLWLNAGAQINQVVIPTASLTLSPTEITAGGAITLTGSGFTPGEHVLIRANRTIGPAIQTVTANAGGSFTTSANYWFFPKGMNGLTASGQSSSKLAAAQIGVNPKILLIPDTVSPGAPFQIVGFGWPAGVSVEVSAFCCWPTYLYTNSGPGGAFFGATAVNLAAPSLPGDYSIMARYELGHDTGGASAMLHVQ